MISSYLFGCLVMLLFMYIIKKRSGEKMSKVDYLFSLTSWIGVSLILIVLLINFLSKLSDKN